MIEIHHGQLGVENGAHRNLDKKLFQSKIMMSLIELLWKSMTSAPI